MKYFALKLIIFTALLACIVNPLTANSAPDDNKTTVLLVGTLHWLPWPMTHNYNYIEDAARKYSPEVICVEYVPTDDSVSMANFYDPESLHRADSVKNSLGVNDNTLLHEIDSLLGIL